MFGAEVFVIGHSPKSETLSVVKNPTNNTFKWKLENFSSLNGLSYGSETLADGERDWYVYNHTHLVVISIKLYIIVLITKI